MNTARDAARPAPYPASVGADIPKDAFDWVPLALVPGSSSFTTSMITRHLLTVAWVVEQMLQRQVVVEGQEGGPGSVHVI